MHTSEAEIKNVGNKLETICHDWTYKVDTEPEGEFDNVAFIMNQFF